MTGTAEAGSTVEIFDENGNSLGTATADDQGNFEATITDDDGKGSVIATATDEAGNTSDASAPKDYDFNLTVTLDTNNIGGADNIVNQTESEQVQKVEIKVAGLQDGETPVFKLGEEKLSGSLKDGTNDTYEVTIPANKLDLNDTEAGEKHSVSISVSGSKGSIGSAVSAEYAVDTTAPTVEITRAEFDNSENALVIEGITEVGAKVIVTIDGTQYEDTAGQDGKFKLSESSINLEENSRDVSITATATDTAGNTGNEATETATIPAANDNPPTPTLSNEGVLVALVEDTGSDTTDKITNNGKLNVTGVDEQKWVYSLDGGENWITGSDTEIQQEDLGGDGDKRVLVSLSQDGTSPITNPKEIEFTLDTKVDAPSISSSYNKNTQVLTVSGTAEANSTIELSVAGNTQTVNVGNNGSFSKDFNVARQDTDFIPGIKATITDKAGNIDSSYGQPANVTIPANLNNRGIELSLVNDSGMGGDGYTNQADFNVSGVDGQQWVYRVDNGAWQTGSDNQITGITGDGQHRVEVSRSEDGTNPIDINTYLPEGFSFTLDTVGASVSDLNATPNGDKVTVSGKTEANLQVTIKVGDITDSATADSNGNFSKDFTVEQSNNQQILDVSATPAKDLAGNDGQTANTSVTVEALPQTDDKVEQARQAIQDLQTAVTNAEQDGTVEHGEYNDLNELRDAAKAAVQAVGESNSAYQELKDDLNSAANYVRGTTFEHAKDVIGTYNKTVTGTSSYSASNAQTIIDVVNAARSMNNLTEITRINDSSVNTWTQQGANANKLEHNTSNSTGSSIVYQSSGTTHNPGEGWVDDSSVDSLGHRMQALNPRLVHSDAAVGNGSNHIGVMLTLEYYNQDLLGGKLYDKGNNHNAPNTIEWPAEGYIPYAMVPNQGIGTGTSWDGGQTWHFSSYASLWTFSAKDQSLNGATVSVSKNGSNIANFSGSQVSAVTSNGSIGWSDPSWYDGDYYYSTIKWDMNGKFSDPGSGVDDYEITITANGGYEYTYHIYVFNDTDAAQNHANQPVSLLSNEIQQPDNLSGNLNSEAVIYTGTQDNDVVPVAELIAGAKVELGAGDDVVEINHYLGGDIDGGDGFDTVVLTSGANALSGNHLNGIEAIDLGSTSRDNPNVVSLTADDLINNHDENGNLWISGQVGDRVALFDGVVESDTTIENADGVVFHQYTYTADNTTYAMLISDELYQNGNGVVI